jgi:glycosyltransferase involved in cell wall biosynthesis
VHDYLTQRGGAERVVLAMLAALPGATLYTSVYEPHGTFPEFQRYQVKTMSIDSLRWFREHPRTALPLLALLFSSHTVDADVVICSSSGWAHGVATSGRKIVYCYTPARWLYQTRRYAGSGLGFQTLIRLAVASVLRQPLRSWDRGAAKTAHRYVAISQVVRRRIRRAYGIDAEVLPPPVSIVADGPRSPIVDLEPGFLLCVSRLLPYKNVDKVLAAAKLMTNERLVVVGTGPELSRLRRLTPRNATLVGRVDDDQMRWLYHNCKGVVAASHEDFGLVPLEAAAFGKPTAALRWGGYLDTIVEGRTGTFFDDLTPRAISESVRRLDGLRDPMLLQQHARKWDVESFGRRVRRIVDEEKSRLTVAP